MYSPAPILSIIIPTYNYGNFISRQLASLESQVNDQVEVIIVDDGSTDDTEMVVQPFLCKNIHYFRKPNGGVASARNFGIHKANGTFLIFIDADDECLPNAISQIIETIRKYPRHKLFIGRYKSVWQNGDTKISARPEVKPDRKHNLVNYLLKDKLRICNGAYIAHRNAICPGFPEHLKTGEDTPLIAQLLSHYVPIVIDAPLLSVHKHADSLRRSLSLAIEMTRHTVSETFKTQRLAPEHLSLKRQYLSRRLLSLTRYHYKLGNKTQCRKSYHAALKESPAAIFRLKYLVCYTKSFF